jgi:hypothetical protein
MKLRIVGVIAAGVLALSSAGAALAVNTGYEGQPGHQSGGGGGGVSPSHFAPGQFPPGQ